MKKYSTLQEIKYYSFIGAAAFVFTFAVLLVGKLLAVLLNTTL